MADPHGSGAGPDSGSGPDSGHSATEIDRELQLRPIVEAGIWTVAISIVAFVAVFFVYRWMIQAERRGDPAASPIPEAALRQLPPEPRLQPLPQKDLAALRLEQQAILGSYGWVDRQAGVARIPIDRAIDLVVQRGLPRPTAPLALIPTPPIPPTPPASAAGGGPTP